LLLQLLLLLPCHAPCSRRPLAHRNNRTLRNRKKLHVLRVAREGGKKKQRRQTEELSKTKVFESQTAYECKCVCVCVQLGVRVCFAGF